MTDHSNRAFPWELSVFPVLEVCFFVFSILVSNPLLSILLVLIASILLSFSIHIFFHECVHTRESYPTSINIINSILLGLPFDGYRVHHYNHHTYANGLKDFSTTWFMQNGNQIGYSVSAYFFGWVRQLKVAIHDPEPFDQNLGDVAKIKNRIPPQKAALLFIFIAFAFIGFKYFILYLMLIYFGWAFSALHNFGQHPPLEGDPVCTYADKQYNLLFFNNGLHSEHHVKPWLSWDKLKPDNYSHRINHAHLIEPCLPRRKE
jgi:fatty acid desaturase